VQKRLSNNFVLYVFVLFTTKRCGQFLKDISMTKSIAWFTLIVIICLTSCNLRKSENKNENQHTVDYKLDTSVVAIIPFDTTNNWIFQNNQSTELTNSDLMNIDTIINKCIIDYNIVQNVKFNEMNSKYPNYNLDLNDFIVDLTNYKRQYVASINSRGEKVVWVNFFCESWEIDWKKNLIIVDDGGNCFLNLKIKLTTGKYYEFRVNGFA